mmetsp:Transcript_34228/g.72909  ORF Transcript_34228/g.72909 Transcript_34228/m.72909 type:complete len:298 (-) Transcript_34228:856-1749(-)
MLLGIWCQSLRLLYHGFGGRYRHDFGRLRLGAPRYLPRVAWQDLFGASPYGCHVRRRWCHHSAARFEVGAVEDFRYGLLHALPRPLHGRWSGLIGSLDFLAWCGRSSWFGNDLHDFGERDVLVHAEGTQRALRWICLLWWRRWHRHSSSLVVSLFRPRGFAADDVELCHQHHPLPGLLDHCSRPAHALWARVPRPHDAAGELRRIRQEHRKAQSLGVVQAIGLQHSVHRLLHLHLWIHDAAESLATICRRSGLRSGHFCEAFDGLRNRECLGQGIAPAVRGLVWGRVPTSLDLHIRD